MAGWGAVLLAWFRFDHVEPITALDRPAHRITGHRRPQLDMTISFLLPGATIEATVDDATGVLLALRVQGGRVRPRRRGRGAVPGDRAEGARRGHRHRGRAFLVDGRWVIDRATVCGLFSMAGVTCPPPPP